MGTAASILKYGCFSPVVVWADTGILLDGHHRKAICEKHGIEYGVQELFFDSRDAAADWIDAHADNQRNLTPEQTALVRGRRNLSAYTRAELALAAEEIYRRQSQSRMLAGKAPDPTVTSPEGSGRVREQIARDAGDRKSESSGQNVRLDKTAETIARQHGVTERTIRRDGQYAEAVDKLGLQGEVTSGKLKTSRKKIVEAAASLGDSPTPEAKVASAG